jgi:CheY-like chemotaxis protein
MVDDEEDLVWSTARQMARERPEVSFEGVTDPEDALARIRSGPPDLLITDVRMPKMSGLALLLAAREVAPDLPVIVVTAYGSPEVRTQVQRAGSVQYLEKPFAFQSLLDATDRALTRPTGFSGAISLPMLPDLIQIYALSQMTGAVRIVRAGEAGAVWFEKGDIVHAACAGLEGPEAFYRLLTWEGGTFSMDPGVSPPRRTIDSGWQELLVEGCRRMDEAQRGEPPTPAEGPAVPASLLAEVWSALRPLVSESSPNALVVGAALEADSAAALQGGTDASGWPQAVTGLLDVVDRLGAGSGYGAVECVASDVGVVVAWDRASKCALAVSDELRGASGVSRFRSNVSRWRAACNRWLRE